MKCTTTWNGISTSVTCGHTLVLGQSFNPKVTWRTEIVIHYFQSEFEGICRTVLEKFNRELLYKFARLTQRHQKKNKIENGV